MAVYKEKGFYHWYCGNVDNTVGCFHADFEGRCEAQSRKPGFKTEGKAKDSYARHLKKCPLARYAPRPL